MLVLATVQILCLEFVMKTVAATTSSGIFTEEVEMDPKCAPDGIYESLPALAENEPTEEDKVNQSSLKEYFNYARINVSPLYRHFGPSIIALQGEAIVMTKYIHEEFCSRTENGTVDELIPYYNDKILFISENLSQSCNTRIGIFPSFSHLHHWCKLNATIIMTNNPAHMFNNFIGYYYNFHEGSKFEDLYEEMPSLRDCSMFEARFATETEVLFLNTVEEAMALPKNKSIKTIQPVDLLTVTVCGSPLDDFFFDHILVAILFRGVIASIYLAISIVAFYFIYLDSQNNYSLTTIHRLTLWVNSVMMLILAVFEALGAHYMFDTVSNRIQQPLFFLLFGVSVGTDYLLSILYQRVIARLKSSRRQSRRESVFYAWFIVCAIWLIVLDLISALLNLNIRLNVYDFLYRAVPIIFTGMQILVNLRLIYQTRILILFFNNR